jgi:hypothetical protein
VSDSTLLRSSAVMAAGTLVSRVLGFVRAILLTGLLGVTGALAADTFATANTVPNNVYNLIAGGLLNAVLVPQIARAARHDDGGQAFLDRLLTVALAALALVTVLVVALAPLVPAIFDDGKWDAPTRALAVAFAFWCLPQVFFYGLYTVLGQVLNARGRFGAYMWAPVLNNIVAIGGIVAMYAWIGGFSRLDPHPPSTWTTGQIALLGGTPRWASPSRLWCSSSRCAASASATAPGSAGAAWASAPPARSRPGRSRRPSSASSPTWLPLARSTAPARTAGPARTPTATPTCFSCSRTRWSPSRW